MTMQNDIKYSSDGQPLYYPELPSIGNLSGHSLQSQHLQNHMQFSNGSPNSSNGVVSSSLHQMHHSIINTGNNSVVLNGSISPDHQIIRSSSSPNSTKKKRKCFLMILYRTV